MPRKTQRAVPTAGEVRMGTCACGALFVRMDGDEQCARCRVTIRAAIVKARTAAQRPKPMGIA
jgi:hypothetical protein